MFSTRFVFQDGRKLTLHVQYVGVKYDYLLLIKNSHITVSLTSQLHSLEVQSQDQILHPSQTSTLHILLEEVETLGRNSEAALLENC